MIIFGISANDEKKLRRTDARRRDRTQFVAVSRQAKGCAKTNAPQQRLQIE